MQEALKELPQYQDRPHLASDSSQSVAARLEVSLTVVLAPSTLSEAHSDSDSTDGSVDVDKVWAKRKRLCFVCMCCGHIGLKNDRELSCALLHILA